MLNAAAHALTANLQLFPFPHSRVKGPKGLYINASYIRGADGFPSKYIGTQVPVVPGSGGFGQKLPSVNLFWEMVLDHRSTVLVTLDESGAPFWPVELSKPSKYGALEVTATKMVPNDDYTAISLEIARPGGSQAHHATLFEFHRWSKTMTNDGVSALLELSSAIGAATKESPSTPIIMIDADGGDRVGTMIAAEHCFEQIRTQDYVDVMRAVADVREDRGGLVSQPELYATIYRLATIYLLGMGVSMNRTDAPPAYAGAPRY
jgi:protein tyrosine phosphatase